MARQYFGTDGIRGTVGQKPITPDFILRLAHAVGRVLKSQEAHPTVLIGKDTRISGYMLESALESGFNSAGVDVVLLGPVPTPAVAYLTRAQRASLGVVISASHNPFADNGIKFFSAQGTKLSDAWEEAVEAALLEDPVWVDSAALGKTRRLNDAAGRYIEFCKSTFSNDLTLKGLKIVVDAAHGAAYQIAPKVLHELGADEVAGEYVSWKWQQASAPDVDVPALVDDSQQAIHAATSGMGAGGPVVLGDIIDTVIEASPESFLRSAAPVAMPALVAGATSIAKVLA